MALACIDTAKVRYSQRETFVGGLNFILCQEMIDKGVWRSVLCGIVWLGGTCPPGTTAVEQFSNDCRK